MTKSKGDIWQIPEAHTNISASINDHYIFSKQDFLAGYTKQFFYYALTKSDSYFNFSFSMKNYKPSSFEYAKINFQTLFDNNVRYNAWINLQNPGWKFLQKIDIPLNKNTYIYPLITIDDSFPQKISSYGSGFSSYNTIPFFSQIRFYDQDNLIEWQASFSNVYVTSFLEFELWILGLHRDRNLEQVSFQLKNSVNNIMQPGLFYSYSKNLGTRWEGFLIFNL